MADGWLSSTTSIRVGRLGVSGVIGAGILKSFDGTQIVPLVFVSQ